VFWSGLAAASIPIIIHLLNRRRFRMKDWAAMQFLWESVRKNRRRIRIEELLLLVLRCLVVAVLAVALARFTGCSAMSVLPGGTTNQTAVFVIDDSYSMGQRVGGGTVLSAAVADVVEQLKKLAPADKVAIMLTSQGGRTEPYYKLTHVSDAELEPLAARLSGLTPSDGRAHMDRSLTDAAKVFREDKAAQRRLFVYGDFRRVDLATPGDAEAIRKGYEELRKLDVEVVAMDFGRQVKGNLTIESIELMDKFAVASVPIRVRLEVRNNGEGMVRDVEVRLKAKIPTESGQREVEVPPAVIESIDARAIGRVEFQVTCPKAGPAVVIATLPPDELPADNTACLALDVRDAVHALVVDGRPDMASPADSESYFLARALDPEGNGSEGTKVEVVSPPGLADAALDKYDLVIMVNVPELPIALDPNGNATYPQVAALAEYVRNGGGLAIFTGDRVNATFYNGPMFAAGQGLSPFQIGPRKGDPDKQEQFFRLDPRSLAAEGVLKVFRDFLAAGMDPTRLIRFYGFTSTNTAGPPPATADVKPPRILARFADEENSPAIVARQFGRGTVLMFYTSAAKDWSDWPADENGTFVAVLNDMVTYLARPQGRSLSGVAGEPIVYELPAALRDARAILKTPLHPAVPVVPLVAVREPAAPGRPPREVLRYDQADRAGEYDLELTLPDGSSRLAVFARTVDGVEGDLTCGRQPALAAAFGSEKFVYQDRTAAQATQADTAESQKEYWTWALAILALLLAAETFLGQRFGHYAPSGKATTKTE
jgi:hypothetical protein